MTLSPKKIRILRIFVDYKCEGCKKDEEEVGTLEPHRIQRGNMGGKYVLRNILMICSKCHKEIHANELGIGGR